MLCSFFISCLIFKERRDRHRHERDSERKEKEKEGEENEQKDEENEKEKQEKKSKVIEDIFTRSGILIYLKNFLQKQIRASHQ